MGEFIYVVLIGAVTLGLFLGVFYAIGAFWINLMPDMEAFTVDSRISLRIAYGFFTCIFLGFATMMLYLLGCGVTGLCMQ